ncbi:MAG: hypothetical protein WC856_24045 [Methylococcaceae bacterium]|jgi:Spy/CpxP family protein refolding chaperone
MKLLPTVVLVLTGLLAGTACQRQPPKPEKVSVEPVSLAAPQLDPDMRRLKEQLKLTEQQTKKLNEILHDTKAQREYLNAQRRAIGKQAMELQEKKLERINAVLTAEQASKYEKILSETSLEDMEAQPSPKPSQLDPVVRSLKKQLRLTKKQTNKLNEIFQDTRAQQEALNPQRAALRNQSMELQKKKMEQINAVLTAEQAKKYEQIRSEPPSEVMEAHPSPEPQPPQSSK